jgi:hypothetical protein
MLDFLLVDHSVGTLAALAASAFLAAVARGFSGFGGALIFVPWRALRSVRGRPLRCC